MLKEFEISGFLCIERLTSGPWQAFERAIARLLAHQGWDNYDVVGGSGDKGADIIAVDGDKEVIFQCKFSERNRALSVDISGDIKRAIDFYEIINGVCVSNRQLGEYQLSRVKILNDQGYNVSTFSGREIFNSFKGLSEWPVEKRKIKEYQSIAVDRIINSYLSGSRVGLISLATGLGKTFVAATFLKWLFQTDLNKNILVLADKKELLLQFDKSIWTSLPKSVSTHLLHESEKPAYQNGIILSTFQSLENYLYQYPNLYFDVIIVDEAHHAPATTYSELLQKLKPRYLLGLTATPFRMDDREVSSIFGEPLIYFDVIKALKYGFLANVDYRIKNDNIDYNWLALNSKQGYSIRQLNKKIFIPERDEEICKQIVDYWTFKKFDKGIVFCNSNAHADVIERILRSDYSFPARALTTNVDSSEERARRLRKFRKGEIKILTCFDMLNEGVDVPDVDFLVYLRVTHSRIIFLQQLGRGLRYKDNKTLTVFDFVADLRRIGSIKNLKNNFDRFESKSIKAGEFEQINLPSEFQLTFSDTDTSDFLNLVTSDYEKIENSELDDVI
ncbi:MAG: DEAD/DEAH box helicase family protein [Bacteroidales bacterium]